MSAATGSWYELHCAGRRLPGTSRSARDDFPEVLGSSVERGSNLRAPVPPSPAKAGIQNCLENWIRAYVGNDKQSCA